MVRLRGKLAEAADAHRRARAECTQELIAAHAAWQARRQSELQVRRQGPLLPLYLKRAKSCTTLAVRRHA